METLKQERCLVVLPWGGWEAVLFRVVGRVVFVGGTLVDSAGLKQERWLVGVLGFLVVGLRVAVVAGNPVPWKDW